MQNTRDRFVSGIAVGGLVCVLLILVYEIALKYHSNVLATNKCEEKGGIMIVSTKDTVCLNVESIRIK